jgi:hypothetical protein
MSQRDPVRDALRALPRERASSDLLARVLDGVERRSARPPVRGRRWTAVAAAVGVLAVGAWQLAGARRERQLDRRARELLAERRQLQEELADLRRLAQGGPALYVSGVHDFDVVVGLSPWLAAHREETP